jgi:hypothetical protein
MGTNSKHGDAMPGTKDSATTSVQNKSPWADTLPALNPIIGATGAMASNIGLTPSESGALDALAANAQLGNPFAPQFGSLALDLLKGGTDVSGRADTAYARLQSQLAPFANGDYLDPNKNPFFAQTTQKIGDDVTSRLAGMYAAAGRAPTDAGNFAQSAASGVAGALGPLYAKAYQDAQANQMAAINTLYSGANATTDLISKLNQLALQNRQAGVGVANATVAAQNEGANALLAEEAKRRGIPLETLRALAGVITPIAGLGGTTTGTSTASETSFDPMKLLGSGGLGSLGSLGSGLGSLASGLAPLFGLLSDMRVKDNVAPIGILFDGTPVYSFNYVGDRTPRMGLIAQDVERRRPDAVNQIGGVKTVDYGKATQRARRIGGLLDKIKDC